jgi:HlyD family secretion protein
MDIKRKDSVAKKRKIRRLIYGLLLLIGIAGATVALGRLRPAAPSVDDATTWKDVVKRGSMLRQCRGLGTLVPLEIHWVPAVTQGRVEKIIYRPGVQVKPDTVLIEMSNPELQQQVLDAEWNVKIAEAQLVDMTVQLKSQRLTQQADAAKVDLDHKAAELQADTDAELAKSGLVADLTQKKSRITAEELANRSKIEAQRLEIGQESIKAQIAVKQANVNQLREQYKLKKSQLDALKVRAGTNGVLQVVAVDVGQSVPPGTNLVRIADPNKLKAELKIAETQAKDVQDGQIVAIDTRNGIIPGKVIRVDPAAQNGTVTVDASLEGDLPKGARIDLSVEGTVELERLENVLYVGRPVHGQENSLVGLFKVEPDGKGAVRVQVKLGKTSVNTIEILDGLKEGDRVILSDTSTWDSADRIRLT